MSRAHPLLSAFNAGEFSPRMSARVAFDQYDNALAQAENVHLLPQGGFASAPGSRFVAEVKDSTKVTVPLSFEFSSEQAYVLETGDKYFRFYKHQGRLMAADVSGAAVANGTFDSGITSWTDQSNGTGAISHDSTNNRLSLDAAGSGNEAIAEQSVTTTATGTEHTLRFDTFGAPGQRVTVRVGSSSGASDYLADLELSPGGHCVSFTPSASPFFIQFEADEESAAQSNTVDNVSIIDDAPIEITTPFDGTGTADELYQLSTEQSADVMYFAHPNHAQRKLQRRGDTSWSLVAIDFKDGPFDNENETATTFTLTAASGVTTLTASAVTGVNEGQGFLATDIGRRIRMFGSTFSWLEILDVASTTSITVRVRGENSVTTAVTRWSLGLWCDTTGYPEATVLHEERLLFGGPTLSPQRFDGSVTADFENFRPTQTDETVLDDDALSFVIAAEVNRILWMVSAQLLIVGTTGGEFRVTSAGAALTPADIDVKRQTSHGSAKVPPVLLDESLVFLQRAKRKVRKFVFDFNVDQFIAPDLTVLSDQITRTGVIAMAYQQEPDSHLWCVRSDGVAAVLVYDPDQNVVGWQRAKPAGTDAKYEGVATIPGADGAGQVQSSDERDEVWVTVSRTINGATKRYIEVFEKLLEGPLRNDYETDAAWETAVLSAQEDAFHIDSGLTYSGAATTTLTGLDHLEGETVDIWANGAVHAQKTVASGSVSLDYSVTKAQVGLPRTAKAQTLKLAAGASATGSTAVAKTKSIRDVGIVFLDTSTVKVGLSEDDLQAITFREATDDMDTAVALVTGEHIHTLDGGDSLDPRVFIHSNGPAPFTVLAIAPEITTNDVP